MCAVAVRAHPGWCFWGSRCAGICPTGSAQLLSPHYPLWTRTAIISFSVSPSLHIYLPHLPLASSITRVFFYLSVYLNLLLFLFIPSFLSARLSPPSLDWLFLWRLLLGDIACRTWFCGSGLLTATGSRRQVWQGWRSQSWKRSIFIRPSF